ncbi:MAG: NAD(P)-dependent oxidoreductase [Bacteroidales bacterium]|jgi:nucleoside-diphosphate-sugar epimerase|nr:NAD(P)-dependent oxidoreductase [Bacteroidales bacterium]
MKAIALTGATSMTGIALIKQCIQHNVEVFAFVRKDSSRLRRLPKSDIVHLIYCNLDNMRGYNSIACLSPIDIFYHIGWADNDRQGRYCCDKQIKNIKYTIDAVKLAKKLGCKKFIGIGSQEEYGLFSEPMTGLSVVNPVSATGIAKYAAGKLSKVEAVRLGLEYNWVRIFSIYGVNDHDDRLIKSFISNCKNNKPIDLGLCNHIWDYLYEDDMGYALFLIADKGIDGKIYCLGSGMGKPLKEYLNIIRDIVNPDYICNYGKVPYAKNTIRYLCANISELTEDTGWLPKITFEEGIKEIISCHSR